MEKSRMLTWQNTTWPQFIEGTSTLKRQNALFNSALYNNLKHHAAD